MADEITKVSNEGLVTRRFTCADGTAIAKGSLLQLTDPFTASAVGASSFSLVLAGVAAEDKVASDGQTSIAVWTDGRFLAVASGSITVGAPIIAAGAGSNRVQAATNTGATTYLASGAGLLGYAMETAVASEPINVRIRL